MATPLSLKEKMRLVSSPEARGKAGAKETPKVPDAPSAEPRLSIGASLSVSSASPTATEGELVFGNYTLRQKAAGFYLARIEDENPGMGRRRLSDYLPLDLSGILELSNVLEPEALHPADVLFLDTETTGLSRAAATLPFLIGLCWIEDTKVITELLFVRNPSGESAALDYLAELWKGFRYMVSYNGKAFDIPLIRNRMILHRKRGLSIGLHFDMLHIMRRLFLKGTIEAHRQQSLEKELLGFVRSGDLPGEEIPQIYFDYVRYGVDRGMGDILHHNHLDLRGLCLLFLEAIRIYRDRREAPEALRSGLARILLRIRREEEALEMLSVAEESLLSKDATQNTTNALPEEWRYRDALLLAQIHRRQKNYQKSKNILEEIIRRYACPYARLSLAKLLEHRLKDLQGALEETRALIAALHENRDRSLPNPKSLHRKAPASKGLFSLAELRHREARLLKKLSRNDSQRQGRP